MGKRVDTKRLIRLRRLTEANDAMRVEMGIPSGRVANLVPPLAAPRDPGAAAGTSSVQESADREASQKVKGAEVERIGESIIRERSLEIRQRIGARLLVWDEVLRLTEAQEIQLRAAMEEGEQKLDMPSRRKPEKGAPFRPYLEEGAALQTAQEEAIKSLVSEDLQVALERQKSSELQTQAEVQAGKALAKLQGFGIRSGRDHQGWRGVRRSNGAAAARRQRTVPTNPGPGSV